MKTRNLLLISLLSGAGSYAQILHVPADYATIQLAINNAVDGDTVLVSPGVYNENINFSGKGITVASLFLLTQDTVYITQTVIDGNSSGSVVRFNTLESSASILAGFTLRNGYASKGGGIYCFRAEPVIRSMRIINCMAFSSGPGWWLLAKGGGIYMEGSSPALNNLTLLENSSAWDGGGIYCNISQPQINNLVVRHNTAVHYGGGIYCISSDPLITNATLSANTGGGLFCESSCNPVLSNVSVTGNTSGYSGGGIYFNSSNPILSNVTVSNNSSGLSGGGLFCCYSDTKLFSVVVAGNHAAACGGGLCFLNSDISLNGGKVTGNSAKLGGGLHCGVSTLTMDSIHRCNIYCNSAVEGNDLWSDLPQEIIVDTFSVLHPHVYHARPFNNFTFSILHGKLAQVNADLYVSPGGNNLNYGLTAGDPLRTIHSALSSILADSTHQNTVHLLPGVYSPSTNGEFFPIVIPDFISLVGSSQALVILNAENTANVLDISNNSATFISKMTVWGGAGSGIYCDYSSPIFTNLTIDDNNGDGINCTQSGLTMQDITITGNAGNGISCSNSAISAQSMIISGNSGNGLRCGSSNCSLSSLKVANNAGSGISCQYSCTRLTESFITGNAAGQGGGIYAFYSPMELQNVVLAQNSASVRGGGLYQFHEDLQMKNVVVSANTAPAGAGLFCTYTAKPSVVNSIIWNNTGEQVHLEGVGTLISVRRSDIEGGQAGIVAAAGSTLSWLEGNIDIDPYFSGWSPDPYAPAPWSPCIDAGTPDTTGLTLLPNDILGNPRFRDGNGDGFAVIDMGPYEAEDNIVGIRDDFSESTPVKTNCLIWNYPNPFRDFTTFEYQLNERASVKLEIFNGMGVLMDTPVNDNEMPGRHKTGWTARDLPAGPYYYRFRAGSNIRCGTLEVVDGSLK